MNLLIQTVNVLRIATGSATVLTCLKSILAISIFFFIFGCSPQIISRNEIIRSGYPDPYLMKCFWDYRGYPSGNIHQIGRNCYKIESGGFEFYTAEMDKPDFCWAAAVQMLIRYSNPNGAAPSQEYIVRRMKSIISDDSVDSGNAADMMSALLGPGRSVWIENGNGNWILNDVASGAPVIAALESPNSDVGHVYIIYGMTAGWGPQGQAILDRILMFDPSPGVGRIVMSADALKSRLVFAVHMRQMR